MVTVIMVTVTVLKVLQSCFPDGATGRVDDSIIDVQLDVTV